MELKAQVRNILGKKVKKLREQELIPAELYGPDIKNIHLSINSKDFKKILTQASTSTVINLVVNDKKYPVLIYDYQVHPISGEFLCVDFYHIKKGEEVELTIPLEFINESKVESLIKQGNLIKLLKEIELKGKLENIPSKIEVDLSKLKKVGGSISIKDLKIPPGCQVNQEPDTLVVILKPIEEEKIEEEKPAEVAEETEVKKEKKIEEAKEKKESEITNDAKKSQ